MAHTTMHRVAAVGTMAAASVGVLAGTASASQPPAPRHDYHPGKHCWVEKTVKHEKGHWVPGHYVHGHWEWHHGHRHYVHGHYVHGYYVPGHKVVKKEVVCDVWGPGGWHRDHR